MLIGWKPSRGLFRPRSQEARRELAPRPPWGSKTAHGYADQVKTVRRTLSTPTAGSLRASMLPHKDLQQDSRKTHVKIIRRDNIR